MNEHDRQKKYVDFMPDAYTQHYERLYLMDFFTAPASIKYHGAYEGGLFDHSLAVAEELVNLTEKLGLTWKRPESPYIVGMFHDLCKTDDYRKKFGSWGYNDETLLPGHGEKSVIMVQRFITLTPEEIACIRWHMGAYETNTDLWNYYGRAVEQWPNVLYTHTADMIASKIRGV